jgi:hypothetical protein
MSGAIKKPPGDSSNTKRLLRAPKRNRNQVKNISKGNGLKNQLLSAVDQHTSILMDVQANACLKLLFARVGPDPMNISLKFRSEKKESSLKGEQT